MRLIEFTTTFDLRHQKAPPNDNPNAVDDDRVEDVTEEEDTNATD